ncbi:class I SAM-dependent methyltransferase [Tumidithrix elongata RA019]|uniref:Class I SAM-dependent methyltransferase n=1 Tax=Tumidithrix elongata BACA0141 TaxID=2716417 RepID=A0AAW9PWQ7_9CYAN|nr:class I SAM-dependent methyltransferase [Tumidithrix elongata RA019]
MFIDDSLQDAYCRVRQQFDYSPYPRVAIATSVKALTHLLFPASLTTANYLRDRCIVYSEGKQILDVGCGSGVTSLVLAEANPGAKIVGIDISQASIEMARQRLQYHGFDHAEFHVMGFEELPQLNQKFDYINCDETLYLLPDQVEGLKAMRSVLQPDGMLKANLHSFYQRIEFFRAQKLSKLLGLMDRTPTDREYSIMKSVMASLQDTVLLKSGTWLPAPNHDDEFMQANYFLQSDKGFTIPEMFSLLQQSDLQFVSMVNWKGWDLATLFVENQTVHPTEAQKIPEYLAQFLANATTEQKLHFYELLNPIHRLLDFWCGLVQPSTTTNASPDQWQREDWGRATAHLHPVLKNQVLSEKIERSLAYLQPFDIIEQGSSKPQHSINTAICLKLLWDGAKTMGDLVAAWGKIKPKINLRMRSAICANLEVGDLLPEAISELEAFTEVQQTLIDLESDKFVLLELR